MSHTLLLYVTPQAMQYLQQLKSERGRARSETIDQRRCAPDHPFMKALSDTKPEQEEQKEDTSKPAMFRYGNI